MKLFAIYAKLNLTEKPDWLDEFRIKYHKPWDWHVTLKQPCYIEEDRINILQKKVEEFFLKTTVREHKIELTFDQVVIDEGQDGITVMMGAVDAKELIDMQKNLCAELSEYRHYIEPQFQMYEEHFNPHITIGDELSKEKYLESLEYLKNGLACKGVIKEVVLSIVNDNSLEEAQKLSNKTVYSF